MGTMKPLTVILEKMLGEHEHLLQLAERKKQILIKGTSEQLTEVVKEENESIHNIERLERERLGTSRLLAMRLGLPPEEMTASKAIERADDPADAARMREIVDRLADVVDELHLLNEANKRLLEQSLEFVQFSIEVLTESPEVPTYGNTGATQNPYTTGRTSYFDSKA